MLASEVVNIRSINNLLFGFKSGIFLPSSINGEVAEWLKAFAWKADIR